MQYHAGVGASTLLAAIVSMQFVLEVFAKWSKVTQLGKNNSKNRNQENLLWSCKSVNIKKMHKSVSGKWKKSGCKWISSIFQII